MRACVGQALAGVGDRPVLARHVGLVHRERDDGGLLRLEDDVEGDQRFLSPRECLADDVIDAGIDRPADLFLEHRAHGLVRRRIGGVEDVRVADVAGEERAGLRRDRLGDLQRPAVDRLEIALASYHAQLLAMRVVGERLDDIRAGVHEIAMQLRHDLGMLEHDLRDERAGLQVAAALELEHVALGADHGPLVEAFQQGLARRSRSIHRVALKSGRRPGTISRLPRRRQMRRAHSRRSPMVEQDDPRPSLPGSISTNMA